MRIQQFLAQAGYGARRKCEALIIAGRVSVNGQIAIIGQNTEPGDDVRVDGKPVAQPEKKRYIALHKPVGVASDRSNPAAPSMFALVDVPERLFGVGRLDKDSSGLILLTNDGDFAHRLTHPSFEHEKEYRVWVKGVPDAQTLSRWQKGVLLEDEDAPTAPCAVHVLETRRDASLLTITMHEGRKRQIRRIAKLLGHPVIALARVRMGNVRLGTLQSGEGRHLSEMEVRALLNNPPASEDHDRDKRPHTRSHAPPHRHHRH